MDGLLRCRPHHIHDSLDQRTRRKVLSRASLHVGGVFLQQALVGVSLHVGFERGPLLFVNQVGDQSPQLGRVLHLVLRLAEDHTQHAALFAQRLRGVPVLNLQLVAFFF